MTHIVAGAYAAAPADLQQDPSIEDRWYALLRAEPLIGGLELPWSGGLHGSGTSRLASLLLPSWQSVVTAIPGTMQKMHADPTYGLASDVDDSRAEAVRDIKDLFNEVQEIRERLGPQSITAVELHSAPTRHLASTSARSLGLSLGEIASWDWDGVALSLEHCDAGLPAEKTQKGFLALTEEIAVVEAINSTTRTRLGITINWGRSALETRSADGPIEHLATLASTPSLLGLMFSGVSSGPSDYGDAFADVHVPLQGTGDGLAPGSLLTAHHLTECVQLAGTDLLYTGVKISTPKSAKDLTARLAPTLATLSALSHARTISANIRPRWHAALGA